MKISIFEILGMLAVSSPFLTIAGLLTHYYLRRKGWRRRRRQGIVTRGYCPSSRSLGSAFQLLQWFLGPSMACVLEAKQDEDADEDDQGDPDAPAKHLHRQLRRIRRGEQVDML